MVPFYNEQENVSPLYVKLTEVMDAIGERYELAFVDDGSKDKTFKVLSDIYEHDPRVNIIQLRRNFGQAPALKAGSTLRAAKSSFPWTEICSTTRTKFRGFRKDRRRV